ncbi:unnamed protein product [Caenorhabditis angaria]|uniref:General transcription factor IIH subunit 4 n=1 Tax=Caenorhabditis angaria TaxID=860376 RepID=A0A9P1N5Q2_9PELO|nr:unnamed protein product [Caenorhabditis angaria]
MSEGEENETCLFLSFLQTLEKSARKRLFEKPSCAFFIFRMLPPMSQQIIVQLIWKGNLQPETSENIDWDRWIKLLSSLDIIQPDDESTSKIPYSIDFSFRRSYLFAVMSGSCRISGLKQQILDEKRKQKEVGKKASERWDCILRYLALPTEQNQKSVSATTRHLFSAAKFTSGDANIEITTVGFQFLLLSPVQQMWTYIIEYFKLEIANGHDIVDLLDLLIQIVLCANKGYEPGHEAFVLENDWDERQNEMIAHLRELGVIFIRKTKDGIFFLTPLLSHLATSELSTAGNSIEKTSNGSVIVETNFRLYAYTSSPLQLAILSTFTEMTYRFNDMSVGMLTRESVRRALQVGITAAQIISFLRTNAHPQCLATGGTLNCLPITVADQIRLWEDERKRMDLKDAYMYSTFESDDEYFGVRNFAQQEGILLWANNDQKLVIVTEDGHERVKQWYKANRKS